MILNLQFRIKSVKIYQKNSISKLFMVPCTWKRLMGKFYYCGISTVRHQIKNPRTLREQKFNFLLRDVLIFLFFFFPQIILYL